MFIKACYAAILCLVAVVIGQQVRPVVHQRIAQRLIAYTWDWRPMELTDDPERPSLFPEYKTDGRTLVTPCDDAAFYTNTQERTVVVWCNGIEYRWQYPRATRR